MLEIAGCIVLGEQLRHLFVYPLELEDRITWGFSAGKDCIVYPNSESQESSSPACSSTAPVALGFMEP